MARVLSLAILAALLLGSTAYYLRTGRATQPMREPGELTLPLVTTATARLEKAVEQVAILGTVQAESEVAVGVKAPARILAILVREGERVAAGQPLARLDLGDLNAQIAGAQAALRAAMALARKAEDGSRARKAEMDAQVAQAESSLVLARSKLAQAELGQRLTQSAAVSDRERARSGVAMAQAALEQAEIGVAQATDAYERLKRLYAKGGIAKIDLDSAESQLRLARAQRQTAEAGLEQARAAEKPAVDAVPLRGEVSAADLEAARAGLKLAEEGLRIARTARAQVLRIAESEVEAARAGVEQARAGVAQVRGVVGGAVLTAPIAGVIANVTAKAGEYAQPGYPLMKVVQESRSRIVAPVSARLAERLRPGMAATVVSSGGKSSLRKGLVEAISPVAGSDGRSFQVRIAYDQSPAPLPSGSSSEVHVRLDGWTHGVAVPAEAVRYSGNEALVFRLEDGTARAVPVVPGPTSGGKTHILRGLRNGDQVILDGPVNLRDGMQVRATGA